MKSLPFAAGILLHGCPTQSDSHTVTQAQDLPPAQPLPSEERGCIEQLTDVLTESSCHVQISTLRDISAEVYVCVAAEIDPDNAWMTHPYYAFALADVPTAEYLVDHGYGHVCEDDQVHL
ncbi:MAG: hypothetical protein QGG40_10195, partial [Myxococcota bacterium]|nr:hypothetical protein [Myxococcota bacterium]